MSVGYPGSGSGSGSRVICSICSHAVSKIHPYHIPQQTQIQLKLPSYNTIFREPCWICLKFSSFLEKEYPAIYQEWQADSSLDVLYDVNTVQNHRLSKWRPYCLEPKLIDFEMSPCSESLVQDVTPCYIQCHFIPQTGKATYPTLKGYR